MIEIYFPGIRWRWKGKKNVHSSFVFDLQNAKGCGFGRIFSRMKKHSCHNSVQLLSAQLFFLYESTSESILLRWADIVPFSDILNEKIRLNIWTKKRFQHASCFLRCLEILNDCQLVILNPKYNCSSSYPVFLVSISRNICCFSFISFSISTTSVRHFFTRTASIRIFQDE